MTVYAAPGTEGSLVTFRPRYDHWIGGEYVTPASGQYFENPSPVNGKVFCEVARGNDVDIERALDAAHAAARPGAACPWASGPTSSTRSSNSR